MNPPNPIDHNPENARERPALTRQIASQLIAGLKFVGRQLQTADLNPHEGRLRGSVMPEAHMHIPDHPPTQKDPM